MRVLILGGGGMLGHKLWQHAQSRGDAYVTLRRRVADYAPGIFNERQTFENVAATDIDRLRQIVETIRPDAVINCVGIVKQRAEAHDPIASIEVNSLWPHRVAAECSAAGSRLVHLSTDCVFSGDRGNYVETDLPDSDDLYGRSKLLGEVTASPHVTFRTSMIGRELDRASGLVEWFLAQAGPVRGFRKAIFSGLTTSALATTLLDLAEKHPGLSGLYHLAADPIDKYTLLTRLAAALDHPIEIVPDDTVRIDRSLDASRLRAATGWSPPSWDDMLAELAIDAKKYPDWRSSRVPS
jgi:dTDP-4-dehydrorhamnose reductase